MMMNSYREVYWLDKWVEDLKKEFSDMKGVDIYTLPPLGVGFIEISASSESEIKDIDKLCASRIISFCEERRIEKHLLGPMRMF